MTVIELSIFSQSVSQHLVITKGRSFSQLNTVAIVSKVHSRHNPNSMGGGWQDRPNDTRFRDKCLRTNSINYFPRQSMSSIMPCKNQTNCFKTLLGQERTLFGNFYLRSLTFIGLKLLYEYVCASLSREVEFIFFFAWTKGSRKKSIFLNGMVTKRGGGWGPCH